MRCVPCCLNKLGLNVLASNCLDVGQSHYSGVEIPIHECQIIFSRNLGNDNNCNVKHLLLSIWVSHRIARAILCVVLFHQHFITNNLRENVRTKTFLSRFCHIFWHTVWFWVCCWRFWLRAYQLQTSELEFTKYMMSSSSRYSQVFLVQLLTFSGFAVWLMIQ